MKLFKTTLAVVIFLLFTTTNAQRQNGKIDHSSWDQILLLHVSEDGLVDYDGVTRDISVIYKYFRHLSEITPQEDWSQEEEMAYWINVYNAAAMKMIVEEYPIKSLEDIEDREKRKVLKLQDQRYSLSDIQQKILKKFKNPKVHFLLNNGSMSAPKLWNRAFSSKNIRQALEEGTKNFINDSFKNQIASDSMKLSILFKEYSKDFGKNDKDIIKFINKYASLQIEESTKLKYAEYDWSLNKKGIISTITSNE